MSPARLLKINNRASARALLKQCLTLIGAGAVFILLLAAIRPFQGIDRDMTDQMFLHETPSASIVVIGIDDATLARYGAWSDWPRDLHAKAIENLSAASPLVIGYDVLFTDSSSRDDSLADALSEAGNVVLPLAGIGNQPSETMTTYTGILHPASVLSEAADMTGHANIVPDADGIVRHMPLVIRSTEGIEYPAFSLSVLFAMFAADVPEDYGAKGNSLYLLNRDIPIDENYDLRINFSPDNEIRPYLSYGDVISGTFDAAMVENKIVIIGMTATGEHDKWLVPGSGEKLPGIYIHATVIDNILNGDFLVESSFATDLLIMLLLLGIAGFALPQMGLKSGAILTGVLMLLTLGLVFLCFENGYIISVLYPLSVPPACFVGNILIKHHYVGQENNRLNQELKDGYTGTIRALAASIEAKDHYTRGHSNRVTEYSLMVGAVLGMPEEELAVLEYAGILHDIGKIGIPDEILTKPSGLTDEEMEIVRRHPAIGVDIIEDVPFLDKVRRLVVCHHERYDGTGYPAGLAGDAIPFGACILAVADSYDSMTSDRSYRKAMPVQDALDELVRCRGSQFCPEAVDAFLIAQKNFRDIPSENNQ